MTPDSLGAADRSAGRALFHKTCANCHKLFDAGGNIGPNITGSQRTNLDYLLQTLVDPSAAVARDYQMQVIETVGGRVITGLVVAESEAAITMQTVNEKVVVPTDEIEQPRRLAPLDDARRHAPEPLARPVAAAYRLSDGAGPGAAATEP